MTPTRRQLRGWVVRALTLALIVAFLAVIPSESADASACKTSGPSSGSYTVSLCLDAPLGGAVLAGAAQVGATATQSSFGPGFQRYIFYLDGAYLLTDYKAPVGLELPTFKFVDGTHLLEVEALMRDGFRTARTSITVSFANGIATPPVNTNSFTPSSRPAGPGEAFVVAFTGDGGDGGADSAAVARDLIARNPNMFAFAGDVYEKGSVAEFYNHYNGIGGSLFGALKSITNPVVGNHEYENGVAPGYFDYWDNVPNHYSYNAHGWHFIALNSNFGQSPGSTQFNWLSADLAANTAVCTVAYFHHPVVSVGPQGDTTRMNDIWKLLADNGVDIVVTGHEHSYQRWMALDRDLRPDPNGITQFVTGGGGHGIQNFARTDSRLAAGASTNPQGFGVLALTLNPDGAQFAYRSITGQTIDSGLVQCNGTAADTTPPGTPSGLLASSSHGFQVDLAWDVATDNVGIESYTVYRDGSPVATVDDSLLVYADTTVGPHTSYTYTVDAVDAAGNHSVPSQPVTVTTPSPPALFSFTPVADGYVDSSFPNTNYGGSDQLRVDASPDARSYLRFDVAGLPGPVVSATLRIPARSNLSVGFDVNLVTDTSWPESGITYATAPAVGSFIAKSGAAVSGVYNEIDVTSYVSSNGTFSFALMPLSNTKFVMGSREYNLKPELVVNTAVAGTGNGAPIASDVVVVGDQNVVAPWVPDVSDPDLDVLACSILIQATNGVAVVAPDCSSGSYTPTAGYSGSDGFTYQASDGELSDDGSVDVTVTALNTAPTAANQSVSTPVGVALTVALGGADADGDCPLSFGVVTGPTNGSLGAISNVLCAAGTASADVHYVPNPGFAGSDSFTFTTTDPSAATSTTATVEVIVVPVQTNFVFNAVADGFVDTSFPNTNYGGSDQLRVDASPDARSYLRFDVSGLSGPVVSARLRIHARSNLSVGYDINQVTDSSWPESGITYATGPAVGSFIAKSGAALTGVYNEIDVTSYVTSNGTFSFALMPLSNTNLKLGSREFRSPPELIIITG